MSSLHLLALSVLPTEWMLRYLTFQEKTYSSLNGRQPAMLLPMYPGSMCTL